MLVLQSCTDPLDVLPSLPYEPYATSSHGACKIGCIEDEDVDIIQESFISIKKEDIDTKQEEIPEDITSRGINSEPDEVS
jgi:hypothetical protein